jgi:hypothetical protein
MYIVMRAQNSSLLRFLVELFDLADKLLNHRSRNGALKLGNLLALGECKNAGNSADSILLGALATLINVVGRESDTTSIGDFSFKHLMEERQWLSDRFSSPPKRQRKSYWPKHAAGTTPGGSEVDDDRLCVAALLDELGPVRIRARHCGVKSLQSLRLYVNNMLNY